MAPRDTVVAPPAVAPRYGLLASAPLVGDGERWQGGIQWEPESCTPGGAGPANCAPLTREAEPSTPGVSFANPFLVWAVEACSALGFGGRDWQGRARRALEASQSFSVAHELWTGDITQAEFADPADQSPYLTDEDTTEITVGSTPTAQAGLATVEATASQCARGRRLMIHMPTWVLADIRIGGESYIQRDGGLLTTDIGSIIVPDAGYPGTPPTGADDDPDQSWIIASPIVPVRLDTVELIPGNLSDARDLAAAVDWSDNSAAVWAQRLALLQLDPCCRFAIPVAVPRLT